MAPIRRYLRITKFSVIEVRIYLDDPAWAETWLLRRNDPALPRIIKAIRPDVLPKLREENERALRSGKKAGKKVTAIRDKVKGDDFEVSLFYTAQTTPHSLLTKHKTFGAKAPIRSNSDKLTSWLNTGTSDRPINLQDEDLGADADTVIVREEEDDEVKMIDIPETSPSPADSAESGLFVGATTPPSGTLHLQKSSSNMRSRPGDETEDHGPAEGGQHAAHDDKKKLVMSTRYEGFSIYGRTLCLMVKRTGPGATKRTAARANVAKSQQMMEDWVSTQAQKQEEGLTAMVEG